MAESKIFNSCNREIAVDILGLIGLIIWFAFITFLCVIYINYIPDIQDLIAPFTHGKCKYQFDKKLKT